MSQSNDLSRSLVALKQDSTLIAVVELSRSTWLVAGIVPGVARHPLKKLEPDAAALLRLLERWRDEALQHGRTIARIAVAFEAGRDGVVQNLPFSGYTARGKRRPVRAGLRLEGCPVREAAGLPLVTPGGAEAVRGPAG